MKRFNKFTTLLSALLLIAAAASAQKEIKTSLGFSDTVETPCSSQGQYL